MAMGLVHFKCSMVHTHTYTHSMAIKGMYVYILHKGQLSWQNIKTRYTAQDRVKSKPDITKIDQDIPRYKRYERGNNSEEMKIRCMGASLDHWHRWHHHLTLLFSLCYDYGWHVGWFGRAWLRWNPWIRKVAMFPCFSWNMLRWAACLRHGHKTCLLLSDKTRWRDRQRKSRP